MADDEHLRREVSDAVAPIFDELRRVVQAMYDELGGAEGIARLNSAAERYELERERWEAEHPGLRFGQHCHCWCRLRGHHAGACDGQAVTFEVRTLYGQPVQVPMCRPCSDLTAARAGGTRG